MYCMSLDTGRSGTMDLGKQCYTVPFGEESLAVTRVSEVKYGISTRNTRSINATIMC